MYQHAFNDFVSKLNTISMSAKALTFFTFLGILAAIVIIFTMRQKQYSSLLSGGIVISIIIWAEINKALINSLQSYSIGIYLAALNTAYKENGRSAPYGIFNAPYNYSQIQGLLVLPAIALLIVGIIELIQARRKY